MPLSTEEKFEFLLIALSNADNLSINWKNVATLTSMSSASKARDKFKRLIEEAGTHQLTSTNSVVPVGGGAAAAGSDGDGGTEDAAPKTPKSTGKAKATAKAKTPAKKGVKKGKDAKEGKKTVTPKKRKVEDDDDHDDQDDAAEVEEENNGADEEEADV